MRKLLLLAVLVFAIPQQAQTPTNPVQFGLVVGISEYLCECGLTLSHQVNGAVVLDLDMGGNTGYFSGTVQINPSYMYTLTLTDYSQGVGKTLWRGPVMELVPVTAIYANLDFTAQGTFYLGENSVSVMF
jgi:hypothetical protein